MASREVTDDLPAEIPFVTLPVLDIPELPQSMVDVEHNASIDDGNIISSDEIENEEQNTLGSGIARDVDNEFEEAGSSATADENDNHGVRNKKRKDKSLDDHEKDIDEERKKWQRTENEGKDERPKRTRQLPGRFQDFHCFLMMEDFNGLEGMTPKSYDDMMKSSENEIDKWNHAMDAEYDSLMENETWVLVDRPSDRKVIDNRWVYKIKHDREGNLRYKARLVIKGYEQVEGLDFDETFAPVVRFETLRTVLCYEAIREWKLRQYDFVTAFLNADIAEYNIYMEQPQGGVVEGMEDKVCLLKKSLYGLHQAPQEWNSMLHQYLLSIGFERCAKDYGLYVKLVEENGEPDVIFLTIYVDDLLLGEEKEADDVERKLTSEFKVSNLGDLRYLLGIEIDYEPGKFLKFSQRTFITAIVNMFGNMNMSPASTPQALGKVPLCTGDQDDLIKRAYPYRSLVGCLQYLTTGSRFDLVNAVRVLSTHLSNYNATHWKMAMRVLKYLVGTIDHGLVFDIREAKKYNGICIETYVDSDWANNEYDRKSITGYVTRINGCTISSKSEKQDIIATSTCHAETVAASTAARDIRWLEQLLEECYLASSPSSLIMDNH
ncbi:hypothetical protein AeMF1_004353 [Aphanomyces euteiches]|nr:hypothetical protein AeMF1_004353 [Aphanomyces euteiches]KAH9187068.1 hypothetical protein AeNC1_010959 [Aphanomyces euteiches]